jgi:uncharacterized protein (DUF697 family)
MRDHQQDKNSSQNISQATSPIAIVVKPIVKPSDEVSATTEKPIWETLMDDLGSTVNAVAQHTGKAAMETTKEMSVAMSNAATHTSKTAMEMAVGASEAFQDNVSRTGKIVLGTTGRLGAIAANTATDASKALIALATVMGKQTTEQVYHWLEQATQGTGQAVDVVTQHPVVRRVSGLLKLDWLVGLMDRIDLDKAEQEVKALQEHYPDESPNQIAHRIMVSKAVYAGGVGLVSNLLPGTAIALLAIDLSATATLQTEMLYQIAAAYGLDLRSPTRKGELLTIFGLAMGGGRAIKLGLELLTLVPIAGAMISASANATLLYSLGYAACRFYEAKLAASTPEPTSDTLAALQAEQEKYLDVALSQQAIMDQILAHMILISYPEKTWEDILPELKRLQLSQGSLEAIAGHLQSPQPLGALLDQLNRDFAVPLLAQCRRIAQTTGDISPAETEILDAIAVRAAAEP